MAITEVPLSTIRGAANGIAALDASAKVSSPVRGIVSVLDYGAVGDGVTDNLSAFNAAVAAFGPDLSQGGTLEIPAGGYYLSDTWSITRRLNIVGKQSGKETTKGGTRLRFPINKTGLRVMGSTESPDGGSAARANIRDILLDGGGGTTGHGIHASTTVYVERCFVDGFAQDGINIVADAQQGTGNANCWSIRDTTCVNNGRDGFYCQGGDVNAGVAINLDASSNGRWGIYDDSFLGNTYVACHVSNNGLGSVKTMTVGGAVVAANVFLGCYVELYGNYGSEIKAPSIVIGGQLAVYKNFPFAEITGDGTGATILVSANAAGQIDNVQVTASGSGYTTASATITDHGSGSGGVLTPVVSGGKIVSVTVTNAGSGYCGARKGDLLKDDGSDGGMVTGRLRHQLALQSTRDGSVSVGGSTEKLLTVQMLDDHALGWQIAWNETDKTINTWHAQTSARTGIKWTTNLSTGVTGGRSAALTGGSVLFPSGFWLGAGSTGRQVTGNTVVPASGEWARGDVVFNQNPSAGGFVGWVCTASGTPGTWKTFGAISA